MQAVQIHTPGGADQLFFDEIARPEPGPEEILVKVAYTALNRADLLQREGKYPVPPGDSPVMGLEMSGVVAEKGAKVTHWNIGDQVHGLLNGGGYAEFAVIHQDMAMPIPSDLPLQQAAAIPEVFLTAFQALHWIGRLKAEEKVLIHAGASGVGTAALQLVELAGATSLVTASAGKHDICRQLGAAKTIDYRAEDFAEAALAFTGNQGVDIIIDFIAADYFKQNLQCLALDGRMIMLALMGGVRASEVNLGTILRKRLQITGSTLRSRSLDYKIRLTQGFYEHTHQHFANGRLRPVIDRVFPWREVAEAHRYMEANKNRGKIVLEIDKSLALNG